MASADSTENAEADDIESRSTSSLSKYPEPSRHSGSAQPYVSAYGLFPGAMGNSTYISPGLLPPSSPQPAPIRQYYSTDWQMPPLPQYHHVTDFSSFNGTVRSPYAAEGPQSALNLFRKGRLEKPGSNQPDESLLPGYGPWPGRTRGLQADLGEPSLDPNDLDLVGNLIEESDLPASGTGRGNGRGRGRGRGGWKRLLKGTEHANLGTAAEDTGKPRGRGRGSGRRGGRGYKHKTADPGQDFKECISKAGKHFLDRDLETAADFARQAVKANPEVFQAHSLLSEILKAQGHDADSVQALWLGAVTIRNADVWRLVARKTLEVEESDRTPARIRTAIECYGEAIKLCKDTDMEYELRVAKLELYQEIRNVKFARLDCKNILKQWPGKSQYVKQYAQLTASLQDSNELQKSLDAYRNVFEVYKDHETFGDEEDETDPWDHLNIYLDLIYRCGDANDGLAKAKQYSRWFIGRKDEDFWDRYTEDDREWDSENDRRVYVGEFQQGKASRDKSKYGDGLPIDIRVRMGLFRLKLGMQQEAIRHFQPLLQYAEEVDDYHDMFLQVSTSLRQADLLQEAADYMDALRDVTNIQLLDLKVWMQLGACYTSLQRPQDAIKCYEAVINLNTPPQPGQHYTTVNPHARAGAALAKLYEDAGEIDKARFMCNDLIRLGRRDLLTDAKVRMIPTNTKYAFTPGTSEFDPVQNMKPRRKMVATETGQMDEDVAGDVGNEGVSTKKPKKPRRKKVSTEDGDLPADNAAGGDEDDGIRKPPKKRVRKRKLVSEPGDEQEGSEATSSVPKRPRLSKPAAVGKRAREAADRHQRIQNAEARSLTNYAVIQASWAAFKAGEDEDSTEQWVEAASSMLEDFKSMKVFFPTRDVNMKLKISEDPGKGVVRDMHHAANRVPSQFLSIPFQQWNQIFVDLAIHYSKTAEQDKCYKILQDVLWGANVFYTDKDLRRANYAASLSCALTFNDSQYWIELARKVISDSDYRSKESFQLLAALNRFSIGSNWFSSGPAQKFMLRMVKQFDYFAMTPSARAQIDWSIQGPSLASKVLKEEEAGNKHELDAGVLMIYGHMVAQANHSHSALPYFYRALALQPDNICVNLSIATMWIQNSMKRQTDNRQFGINQGLSAFYRYYDLRIASGKACHLQEAEYNLARMWHHLGLNHLAMPAYEKVLDLSGCVQEEGVEDGASTNEPIEDFAAEAAFALQGLYALAGNDEAARAIGEAWLVL